jgi:D-3-phosphoglycerate dehydrogenase
VTPHAAFYSEAGYVDMRRFSAEVLVDFLINGRLRNNVNPGWEPVQSEISSTAPLSLKMAGI